MTDHLPLVAILRGLTPRESSSGQRRCLGGISKRGDRYLRMLFSHGARSALLAAMTQDHTGKKPLTRLQRWAVDLAARVGHNRAGDTGGTDHQERHPDR